MFIDRAKIKVRAGKGGAGCVSFLREKFMPRGGPNGGNGGAGGDVIFVVDGGETTLQRIANRPAYSAEDGGPGLSNNKTGASGDDIRLTVPPGTIVRDVDSGEIVCELVEEDSEAVVAQGGKGGRGNTTFVTSIKQTPQHADPGQPGEERQLEAELKIVADIGLVGFPNAGKSTLINGITSARAKIGAYPFTTLQPVIGTLPLALEDLAALHKALEGAPSKAESRVVMADIPGILKGAHEGVGLGLDFLRHIERTKVLVFVLDVSIHREHEPAQAYAALVEEIGSYNPELLERPRVVALNKIDDPLEVEEVDEIRSEIESNMAAERPVPKPGTIFQISALEKEGLEPLRKALVDLVIFSRVRVTLSD